MTSRPAWIGRHGPARLEGEQAQEQHAAQDDRRQDQQAEPDGDDAAGRGARDKIEVAADRVFEVLFKARK